MFYVNCFGFTIPGSRLYKCREFVVYIYYKPFLQAQSRDIGLQNAFSIWPRIEGEITTSHPDSRVHGILW